MVGGCWLWQVLLVSACVLLASRINGLQRMTNTLRLQVCKCYLLYLGPNIKYVDMTYFGLFGAPGTVRPVSPVSEPKLGLRAAARMKLQGPATLRGTLEGGTIYSYRDYRVACKEFKLSYHTSNHSMYCTPILWQLKLSSLTETQIKSLPNPD